MKTEISLSVEAELVEAASRQDIDLARVLEEALIARVKKLRSETWLQDNKSTLASYARYLEQHELFGDEHRSF